MRDSRLQQMRSRLARWLQTRGWRRLPRLLKLPRWWRWALLAVLLPICLVNLTVAWVGRCSVFPLSPFHLGYKVEALGAYAWHRPRCAFVDDAPLTPAARARRARHHLPCGLLGAIVQVESGGQPHRISSAGAMGPMQLIPPTARALGVSDPFDPEESLDGAARYLHTQLATFHRIRLAVGGLQRRTGRDRGRPCPAERPDRDLRRPRHARSRGRAPRALLSALARQARRTGRDGEARDDVFSAVGLPSPAGVG